MSVIGRLWREWSFRRWPAAMLLLLIVVGLVLRYQASPWARDVSANLFADLFVAVGVGFVVAAWYQRVSKLKEERKKAAKIVDILLDELQRLRELLKGLQAGMSADLAVVITPLPMGGWRSVSSGPLLDSVPPQFLSDLLMVYSAVENINVVSGRVAELSVGVARALSGAEQIRVALTEFVARLSESLLDRLDSTIPRLEEYTSDTQ